MTRKETYAAGQAGERCETPFEDTCVAGVSSETACLSRWTALGAMESASAAGAATGLMRCCLQDPQELPFGGSGVITWMFRFRPVLSQ